MNRINTRMWMLTLVSLVVGGAIAVAPASAQEKIVTIGTAGVTGVYYPAGGAICRLVNRGRKEHGFRCFVESTGGSINNLEMIRKRELDMGIVQSDLLYQAYSGSEIFSDVGADDGLRILFYLHSEPFTVIARKSAEVKTFGDLRGKRVYSGPAGSGMRATMEDLIHRYGWTDKDITLVELQSGDQVRALCNGKIDALVFAGGHPNGAVQQITSACPTRLVDVSGPVVDKKVRENPFYTRAIIPGGMYPGNERDTRTFGVDAVLVASRSLEDDAAYEIVKSVFENLDTFKTLHPVFATLQAGEMTYDAKIAPFHPGALRYYKEKPQQGSH